MSAAADALMGIFGFKRVEGEGMKTDRELLELAANAAGIQILWKHGIAYKSYNGVRQTEWMPLSEDGDALRLAADLSLCVFINGMFVHADCKHCPGGDIGYFEENSARNGGCIYAATRRAIVRAAAAIGEQMK